MEEAIAGLEQVSRRASGDRDLPYDAALSSLDLSRALAESWGVQRRCRSWQWTMGSIFKAKKIHREALASLKLFCEAAQQGAPRWSRPSGSSRRLNR